ncbi:MAG: hypothetical protein RLZZ455_868 [Candidatus Parcubacteria bacterium]|jgi:beta-lactamase class A
MGKAIYIFVLLALLGIILWMSMRGAYEEVDIPSSLSQQEKRYPLLSKRILQDYPVDLLINFRQLRKEIRRESAPYQDTFGLYFEYLPTGTTIGINEKNDFTAASLLKVPIVMAYFFGQEKNNSYEDVVATITEEDINKSYGTLWKRGIGKKIRISEAIELALTQSDNTAINVISRYVSIDDYHAVNEGLDIELKELKSTPIITLKQYASILKALYFSSVISKDHSQQILHLLEQSKFRDKIPAGVGKEIKVANKVGLLEDKLYTDCGIVYLPRRSYLLCMVSATDEITARQRMVYFSRKVYSFLKSAQVTP